MTHARLLPEPASDASACDREPIHLSSSIQPQGELFVLHPHTHRILQSARTSGSHDQSGLTLEEMFPASAGLFADLDARLPSAGSLHLGAIRHEGDSFDVVGHRSGDSLVIEFERADTQGPATFDEVYPQVREFLDRLRGGTTIEEITKIAAAEIRNLTGFDRSLVYRFDDDWNGEVVAEDNSGRLPSYLGLHFPASDIPAQARELYRKNRIRLIADANYTPVPVTPQLNPETGRPLDLSYSVLRSVSPVHVEYMRNMGTMASMSISLMQGDRLWGLISCHHSSPARVSYQIRNACDFIGQVLSLQIAAREAALLAGKRQELRALQRRLLSSMAAADHFIDGLTRDASDLIGLTHSSGAAVIVDGTCRLVGETPSEAEVTQIADWFARQRKNDIFVTSSLREAMPSAEAYKATASGLIAISISQVHNSLVIWFRPEVIQTVSWGGEPGKTFDASLKIHPRTSFETWKETVRLQSLPWHEAEIDAASELRTAIVDIVLRKAEEMAALSERLSESNKELEAFSYSVSHDLRAPFRHIVGFAQLLKKFERERLTEKGNRYIDTIVESAVAAGTLVDNLLSFSQMGRSALRRVNVDVEALVEEAKKRALNDVANRQVEWRLGPLPPAEADPIMLRLVFQNLIENAVKFTRGRNPAVIEVGFTTDRYDGAYFVRDNGTGFDMAYVGKLFGVFQRLHRVEDFEGTGIGLANVKRIVERHGGRVSAEGALDRGTTIYFTLPEARKTKDG